MVKNKGIPFSAVDNHKAWTLVKFFCFSANANPAFWFDLDLRNKELSSVYLFKNVQQNRREIFVGVFCLDFFHESITTQDIREKGAASRKPKMDPNNNNK